MAALEAEQGLLRRLRGSGNSQAVEQSAYADVMKFLWPMEHWWCEHQQLMELSAYLLQFGNPSIEPFRTRMGQQLNGCAQCVAAYHGTKPAIRDKLLAKYSVAGVERFFGKIRALDGARLSSELAKHPDEGATRAFREILQHPDGVLDSAAVCAAVATFVRRLVSEQLPLDFSTPEWSRAHCPGVYQLMLHNDVQLRSWAHAAIQLWGSVETAEQLLPLVPTFERCMQVLEGSSFKTGSEEQPTDDCATLYLHSVPAFWNGLCRVLESIEPEPFNEVIMTNFPTLLDIVTIQLSADQVTWQTVRCINLFVERLREDFWEYSHLSSQFLIDSVESICLRPNPQLEMLQRHSISLLDSVARSLEAKANKSEVASVATFLLATLPGSRPSKTICTVGRMKGLGLVSQCAECDVVLPTCVQPCVQALRAALQSPDATDASRTQAMECVRAVLWMDVRMVLQLIEHTSSEATAGVHAFDPLWFFVSQICSSNTEISMIAVECQLALGSQDATHNQLLSSTAKQHLTRIRHSFSRCVAAFHADDILQTGRNVQDLTSLLLCPHKGVRTSVEEALKRLTKTSNKVQVIKHLFSTHTAATLQGWQAAFLSMLHVKPRNCFGCWLPTAQLCKMLPKLMVDYSVASSEVDKTNGLLWGIIRRVIQAASRFVDQQEYEPTMATFFDMLQLFWISYFCSSSTSNRDSHLETLEMLLRLGATCGRESLRWRWLKVTERMCVDLETARMVVPKPSLIEASRVAVTALQTSLSLPQLQQLRIAMPWLRSTALSGNAAVGCTERMPVRPASKPSAVSGRASVRQPAAGQLTSAQLAEISNRTTKAQRLQQHPLKQSATATAPKTAPSQHHWSTYVNQAAAKPATKAAPQNKHWSSYVDTAKSTQDFDKRSYAAPSELAEAKKPARQMKVVGSPTGASSGPLRRHLGKGAASSPAVSEKAALKALKRQVLEWDCSQLMVPSRVPQAPLEHIPKEFCDLNTYTAKFMPMLLQEIQAHTVQALERDGLQLISQLLSVDGSSDLHTLRMGLAKSSPDIRENDLVVVSREPLRTLRDSPTEQQLFTFGIVDSHRRAPKQLKATCSMVMNISIFMPAGSTRSKALKKQLTVHSPWHITRVDSLTTALRECAGLATLSSLNPILRSGVLNPADHSPSLCTSSFSPQIPRANYNESQWSAIQQAATLQRGFCLLQGPPGTGKSHTVVGLLCQLCLAAKGRKQRILLCAPSNAAVDEIARRLLVGIRDKNGNLCQPKVLRVGHFDSVHPDVRSAHINTVAGMVDEDTTDTKQQAQDSVQAELQEVRAKLEKIGAAIGEKHRARAETCNLADEFESMTTELSQMHSEKSTLSRHLGTLFGKSRGMRQEVACLRESSRVKALEDADVVCSTLTGSGVKFMKDLKCGFDTVIVDEAAQAVELATLIPLRAGCERCILVGDPKQLPATVISQRAKQYGYDRSMFERMQQCGYKAHMLEVQYRMHPDICSFPSSRFYSGKLRTGSEVANRSHQYYNNGVLQPLCFWDTNGSCPAVKTSNHSWKNPAEASAVVDLIHKIIRACESVQLAGSIGVVTPYAAQVREIQDTLTRNKATLPFAPSAVEVNSVDGFQGREKDIIIFSCVRSGQGVGFVADVRRMNVGLTRAKFALVVIGDGETLSKSPDWGALVKHTKSQGSYKSMASRRTQNSNSTRASSGTLQEQCERANRAQLKGREALQAGKQEGTLRGRAATKRPKKGSDGMVSKEADSKSANAKDDTELRKVKDVTELRKVKDVTELRKVKDVTELRKVKDVTELRKVKDDTELRKVKDVTELRKVKDDTELRKVKDVTKPKKENLSLKLSELLDSNGGVKSNEMLVRFVRLMRKCTEDSQRMTCITALSLTDYEATDKQVLTSIVGTDEKQSGECLQVLTEWLAPAADKGSSLLLVSILRVLKTLPVTTKALIRTNIGKRVKKLQKYNPTESAGADPAGKVPKLAGQLVKRWTEQAFAEQAAAKGTHQPHPGQEARQTNDQQVVKDDFSHPRASSSTPNPNVDQVRILESKQSKTIVKLTQSDLRLPKRPVPTVGDDNPKKRLTIVMPTIDDDNSKKRRTIMML